MDRYGDIGVNILERDDAVVVVVEGEVDLLTAEVFHTSLARAGASRAPGIVLDLDRVSFMDSAGIHVLLQFAISELSHGRLAVTRGSPQVRRLLEITGVGRYLSFVA